VGFDAFSLFTHRSPNETQPDYATCWAVSDIWIWTWKNSVGALPKRSV